MFTVQIASHIFGFAHITTAVFTHQTRLIFVYQVYIISKPRIHGITACYFHFNQGIHA